MAFEYRTAEFIHKIISKLWRLKLCGDVVEFEGYINQDHSEFCKMFGIQSFERILKEEVIYIDPRDFKDKLYETAACSIELENAHAINNFFDKWGIDIHLPENNVPSYELTVFYEKTLTGYGYADDSDIDESFTKCGNNLYTPRYVKWSVKRNL